MVAVQVRAGSEEFTTVEKNLKATAGGGVNSIVKVHIIYCDWLHTSTAS